MRYHELLIYRSRHQALSVRDLSVSWRQGTPSYAKIRWRGKTAPTFTTSGTLPSGVTMSTAGIVTYDGTACTPDTYTWAVSATDGTDTVTATVTMTMGYAILEITPGQTVKFKLGEPSSYQIQYSADGTPTFATSTTLPAGVTMTTGGLIEYDGTGSTETTVSVAVTATMTFAQVASATVGVELAESTIPQDYIWYTPFTSDYTEETSGIVGVAGQPSAFSIATDSSKFGAGYLAARKTTPDSVGIEYANTATYMDLSAGDITISLWLRAPDWSQYSQLLGGTRPYDGAPGFVLFADFEWNGVLDFRSATNNSLASPQVNQDSDWHHYLFTRTAQGSWTWYRDGVASTSGTGDTGSINGTRQNMKIGGGTNWTKDAYFDLAQLRIYGRVLTAAEIEALKQEFTPAPPTPTIPTDYVFYASLKDSFTPETGTMDSVASRWSISTAPDGVPAACNTDTSQGDFTMVGMRYVPATALQGDTNLTCSVWIYGTRELNVTPPDQLAVIGAGAQSGRGVLLEYRSRGSSEFPWNNMSVSDTTVRPSNGEWHNVLFTYERGVSTKVYVDGALSIDYTPGASVTIDANYIYVGGRYSDGRPWVGYMREAMVWTRVLTSGEIADIYNAGL